MSLYPPGSFTKNFGWNNHPPGLSALHTAIRKGFDGSTHRITREEFRAKCGVEDRDKQLILLNFFLHNTVHDNTNYVSMDELVRHALSKPYSRNFDMLALFALHLSRQGQRVGSAGTSEGASFTGDYVRRKLWSPHGWQTSQLARDEIIKIFNETIIVSGDAATARKCATNYYFILQQLNLTNQSGQYVNNHLDGWIGPALFLAFDRYCFDEQNFDQAKAHELIKMARNEQIFKLLGTDFQTSIDPIKFFAWKYVSLRCTLRCTHVDKSSSLEEVYTTPPLSDEGQSCFQRAPKVSVPSSRKWSDDDAEEKAQVLRKLRETRQQLRDQTNVKEIKGLYDHECAFCGKQIIVSVNPIKYYSEAAHIKPVGLPHNGPDTKDNMLVLCPEHHLQFDRGILTINNDNGYLTVSSKIHDDPIHGRPITLKPPHEIDPKHITWHNEFWNAV